MHNMWKRAVSRDFKALAGRFPAILLLGARQVGKTTLARAHPHTQFYFWRTSAGAEVDFVLIARIWSASPSKSKSGRGGQAETTTTSDSERDLEAPQPGTSLPPTTAMDRTPASLDGQPPTIPALPPEPGRQGGPLTSST